VPGFEVAVVDDAGVAVAPGTVGHLLVKGPTTSPYYWNRVQRTRSTMQGPWLRTGDMVSEDRDGFFTFAGRSDDMLKVSGMWVSPAEIEALLGAHPAVLEAGVVAARDGEGLTKARAFVVLKEGWKPSDDLAATLIDFVRTRGGGYKAPAAVDFVDDLPRTATGKVQRIRLRAPEPA
jgi:acyl-coenzyme A synthetase/AMP-(fatty) acid ligase